MFRLQPVVGGPTSLPITYTDTISLPASAESVFAVLADIGTWDRWFSGMRKVHIDGADRGVGALRTVFVGATSVQERFDVWEDGELLGLQMTQSNLPGLRRMAEEWRVVPTSASSCRLEITVGIEPRRLLIPLGPLVKAGVHQATRGGANIVSMFPAG